MINSKIKTWEIQSNCPLSLSRREGNKVNKGMNIFDMKCYSVGRYGILVVDLYKQNHVYDPPVGEWQLVTFIAVTRQKLKDKEVKVSNCHLHSPESNSVNKERRYIVNRIHVFFCCRAVILTSVNLLDHHWTFYCFFVHTDTNNNQSTLWEEFI